MDSSWRKRGGRAGSGPAALLAGLMLGLSAAAAGASTDSIHHYERLAELRFAPASAGAGLRAAASDAGGARLQFEAQGRSFTLLLESNSELLTDLPAATRDELRGVEVFRGRIEGEPDSWVRLTRIGEDWMGLLFDGTEILAIEPELRGSASSSPILYRAADTESPGTCAAGDTPGHPRAAATGAAEPAIAAPAAATLFLDVAVIGDVAFTQNETDPMGTAVALFNAVDGLYSDQVGVAINVVDIDLLSNDGNLSASDAGFLLDQLSERAAGPGLDNPGLVHLLTGRNMLGSTVGIAFLGVLCDEADGVGISEIRNSSFARETILVAHELGHNFDAPHDNEPDSPCSSTSSGFVMNPSLNSSSETFSNCSLSEMAVEISRARCLGDLPPPEDPGPCLFDRDFSAGAGSFVFERDSQTPKFTVGSEGVNGLVTEVGGVNGKLIRGMTGTWDRDCRVANETPVTIRVDASLAQTGKYDKGEKSRLRVRINGDKFTLARLKGRNGSKVAQSTGIESYFIDTTLPSGDSRIRLECINNRKDSRGERTTCEFERLSITAR